jgi:hypothetical protein
MEKKRRMLNRVAVIGSRVRKEELGVRSEGGMVDFCAPFFCIPSERRRAAVLGCGGV